MGGASTAASAETGGGTMSLAFASVSTSALSGTTSHCSPTSSSATAVRLHSHLRMLRLQSNAQHDLLALPAA
jgi:hypothetical protein